MPGTKEEEPSDVDDFVSCGETEFRAIVARINYMASDMPDVQFACKEVCREMSSPTRSSWAKLKRLGRYLVGRPRVLWRFPWKEEVGEWKVYTDSDWAGEVKTRKSTSGGLIALGDHCLKTWSNTQDAIAFSSCEAEYYALVEGATRALGLQSAAKELGVKVDDVEVQMNTDSSAAKSFASRRGSGRVRHIETKWLWLQQAVAEGRFRMRKIKGSSNPADVCTKYLTRREAAERLRAVNIDIEVKNQPDAWRRAADFAEGGLADQGVGYFGRECSAFADSRESWADALDSEGEAAAVEAVGPCSVCGSWAGDCLGGQQPPEEECESLGLTVAHLGPNSEDSGVKTSRTHSDTRQ